MTNDSLLISLFISVIQALHMKLFLDNQRLKTALPIVLQMNCAHLENCLHEAREEAQTHLCAADRRASEYSALRISAVKTRGLFERLKNCVLSSGVATFSDSLRGLAQSLSR